MNDFEKAIQYIQENKIDFPQRISEIYWLWEIIRKRNPKVDMQNEQEILNRCELLNRMIAESGEYKAVAQYKVDDVTSGIVTGRDR